MGLGYIGLPTATFVAGKGLDVVGVDINDRVVNTINQGKIHIVEPGLQEFVKDVVQKGKLRASLRPEEADVFLIVVPTPFKGGNHEPDLTYVQSATQTIIPFLKAGDLFIIESTSPVGTTEKMARLIFSERPELEGNLYISYCPERVMPGNVLYELEHNDRVIGGINMLQQIRPLSFTLNL